MPGPIVHIGYHKTGTTWLEKRLFDRPEVGFESISLARQISDFVWVHDLDFDPARYRAELAPRVEHARREGRIPLITSERLAGNPHSGSYDSKRLAERLHEVFPDARILIVIREQRAMLLSTYAQYVKAGGLCSLRDYVEGPRDHRLPLFSLDQFRYDRLVAFYQTLFGRESVLVQPYEHFRSDPESYVRRICQFCGAKPPPTLAFSRVENRSLGPLALSVLRRLNPFLLRTSLNGNSPVAIRGLRGPGRALVRRLDALTPASWNERVRRRWRRYADELAEGRYAKSNRRTAELTGLDLEAFGYDV
jgi:hypothetical protein